ncbi:MAG: hypothetical protein MUF45_12350 [Spirosomaceae bacterium]|jgi:hypothetical protein|nr:hypothetical protein [Spirosomataceae bacterium]
MKKVSILSLLFLVILITMQGFSQNGSVLIQSSNDEVLVTKFGGTEPNLAGKFARGTSSSPTATFNGDNLTSFSGRGYNGTSFFGDNARITMSADENFTSTANGTRITFSTTLNGTTTITERMRIRNNGFVGIGTTSPESRMHIVGTQENNGTDATVKISNGATDMLFDSNEIDVSGNSSIFINNNSSGNVYLAGGGGKVIIGNNGSPLNEIIKVKVSLPTFTVAANTCESQIVGVANAAIDSAVSCSPEVGITEGLIIAYARVSTAGNVLIRICNFTSTSKTQGGPSDFYIGIIR